MLALAPPDIPAVAAQMTLPERISHLGLQSDYRDLEGLDGYGCRAVSALVSELHVVRARELKPDEQSANSNAIHVVWTIASLRYITGLDYYGNWNSRSWAKYSIRSRFFLTQFSPGGQAKFFASWMSTGTLYFSPLAIQAQIIEKWKRYAASGRCKVSD